jgi:hypothetical protein
MNHHYRNRDLIWRGNDLCLGSRRLVSIEQDQTWPSMWRVRHGDKLSDMVNRTRARDAARCLALDILNTPVEGLEPPYSGLNRKPIVRAIQASHAHPEGS